VIFLLVMTGYGGYSQNSVNSPYSRFGLGDIHQQGFVRNMAMGGISFGLRNPNSIDYVNPASFSARDTMSFLFDFAMQGKRNNLNSGELKSVSSDFNFRHLALAFPITRWLGTSVGITPYSTMSYSLLEQGTVEDLGQVNFTYRGEGNLSRFYLGAGTRLGKYFSLGLSMNYLFGNLERGTRVSFPDDAYAAETLINYKLQTRGIYMSYGAQFMLPLPEDYFFHAGVLFENETPVSGNLTHFSQYILSPGEGSATYDTLINETSERDLLLPTRMGFGISAGKTNHFTVGADYSHENWSPHVLPGLTDSLTTSQSFRAGLEFIPDASGISSYFSTVRYRLGGYYHQGYLKIREEQINDFGITFGLGLPLPRTNNTFNVAFQLGRRGSLSHELIRETYGTISFSLTLYDFWFIKYKFD